MKNNNSTNYCVIFYLLFMNYKKYINIKRILKLFK